MRNSLRSTLQRLGAEIRGAEIAEAAAVLPLMFMMLLGIFWFGQAFSIYGAITRAAQEGARAGAAPLLRNLRHRIFGRGECSQCGQRRSTCIQARPRAYTDALLNPSLYRLHRSHKPMFDRGRFQHLCAVPSSVIASVTGTGVCGMSVTFQYPFQFWLPFTSLNKQQILLTASARVRMETQ